MKIEKYSQDQTLLNKDQLEAIKRQPEVMTSIKELEEISKQFGIYEQELLNKAEQVTQSHKQEMEQGINQAIQNTIVFFFNIRIYKEVCFSMFIESIMLYKCLYLN